MSEWNSERYNVSDASVESNNSKKFADKGINKGRTKKVTKDNSKQKLIDQNDTIIKLLQEISDKLSNGNNVTKKVVAKSQTLKVKPTKKVGFSEKITTENKATPKIDKVAPKTDAEVVVKAQKVKKEITIKPKSKKKDFVLRFGDEANPTVKEIDIAPKKSVKEIDVASKTPKKINVKDEKTANAIPAKSEPKSDSIGNVAPKEEVEETGFNIINDGYNSSENSIGENNPFA